MGSKAALRWGYTGACATSEDSAAKSDGRPALPWQLTAGVSAEAQMVAGRAGSTAATLSAALSRPLEQAPPLSVAAGVLL